MAPPPRARLARRSGATGSSRRARFVHTARIVQVDATDALWADEPIRSADDDALGRAAFAGAIARQIHTAPRTAGFVIAIHGPWGDGKTSVLNMVEEAVRRLDPDAIQVRFDPWLFSTGEGLVVPFLEDLGVELSTTLGQQVGKRVRDALAGYADILGKPGEAMKRFASQSVRQRRDAIAALLAENGRRIVVRIDDIDRLTPDEIRDVVRLVKLIGDFPQTVYVLAFERERVERVLGEQLSPAGSDTVRAEGRAYLEKIVQVANDLPPIEPDRMERLVDEQLREQLTRVERPIDDDARFTGMVGAAVAPHVRNLRDLRRFLNALALPLELLGEEINPIDLVGLTALRTFEPEVHDGLVKAQRALTGPVGEETPPSWLLARATGRPEDVERALGELFPPTIGGPEDPSAWRRDRRVAVIGNLLRYLHGTGIEDSLSNAFVANAVQALGDPPTFEILWKNLHDELVPRLAEHMLVHLDRFPAATAAEAARILLERTGGTSPGPGAALARTLLDAAPAFDAFEVIRDILKERGDIGARWDALRHLTRALPSDTPEWLVLAKGSLDREIVAATAADLIASRRRPELVEVVWREKRMSLLRELARDDRGLAAILAARMSGDAPQHDDQRLRELRQFLDEPRLCERIVAMDLIPLRTRERMTVSALKRLIRADDSGPLDEPT